MKKNSFLILLILAITIFAVPTKMQFQGRFNDDDGVPYHGEYETIFRIYDSETGGSMLWNETQDVNVRNGLLNVYLGDVTPINDVIFDGSILFLEVIFDGETMPRQPMVTVPYAFMANTNWDTLHAYLDTTDAIEFDLDTLGAYLDTTFSASVSHIDSLEYIINITHIDSIHSIDSITYISHITHIDSISAIDSISFIEFITHIDSIHAIDSITYISHVTHIDSVSYIDSIAYIDFISFIDSIMAIDSVSYIDFISYIDSILAIDSVSYIDFISYIDSIRAIDSLAYIELITHIDSIMAIDSLFYAEFIEYIDSIRTIDSILYAEHIRSIDSVGYIDSIGWIGHTGHAVWADSALWANDAGHVHWDSIIGIPEGFADGTDDGDAVTECDDAIVNQNDSTQSANFIIEGVGEVSRLVITPNSSDTVATPRAGMFKTIGFGESYRVLTFDGECWREITLGSSCITSDFYIDIIGASNDTICLFDILYLTVSVGGGLPPFAYDWSHDGLGDWDDGAELTVNVGSRDTIIICQVVDYDMEVTADTIDIIAAPCDCGTCVDIDGNSYETIQIGDQCWMAENLRVTHYRDGTPIPNVSDFTTWNDLTSGAYCAYDNDLSFVDTYGLLYNWYAVDDLRNLAPEGWHIPTEEEWQELEMTLGMSETVLEIADWRGTNEGSKIAGTAGLWLPGVLISDPSLNLSDFNALPSGVRHDGVFGSLGTHTHFWSVSGYDATSSWRRSLRRDHSNILRITAPNTYGFSIRCIRD